MSENDLVVAALCVASPFCVVAGLLSGLLWRIHLALGAIATLGTVCFLAIGLMPVTLLPTTLAVVIWTAVGSTLTGILLKRGRGLRARPTKPVGSATVAVATAE